MPDTPTFLNPYADDAPERAAAFAAGYIEGGFGAHGDVAPSFDDPELTAIWIEGNRAGRRRFHVYQTGYARGMNAGLLGLHTTTPNPHPSGDEATAWNEGRDKGLLIASEVVDAIQIKAGSTAHFTKREWPIHARKVADGVWRYWQYYDERQRCIFLQGEGEPPSEAYAVDAPHFPAYESLEGADGPMGLATADTQPCQGVTGTGRFSAFKGGEIYSTAQTLGAVRGGNLAHWHGLGGPGPRPRGPMSYLGFPTSIGDTLPEGGWGNSFQNGDIFWWPGEPKPIDVPHIEIRYRGLNCFGVTDGLGRDEPYPIFTVLGPLRFNVDGEMAADERTFTRVGPMESAKAGDSFPHSDTIYRGPIGNVGGLAVVLMEHDSGDPEAYRGLIEGAVRTALGVASAAIAATGVGMPVAAVATWLLQTGAGPLAEQLNRLVGSGDDTIASFVQPLDPRALYELARDSERRSERSIEYQLGGDALLSGHGASYKTYFDVVFVD